MNVRTRFSPSPTGMIHLGNARAALFSALFAAKQAGHFILRIEDTDATRSEERYVNALQEDLQWLGVEWQEGPGKEGAYGPYWQSQRQPFYAKYYQVLEQQKLIYPCFCSDQELMLARKIQLSRGQAPRYSGTCRRLTVEDITKRLEEGKKPAWRYAVPSNTAVEFIDLVKGPQSFQSADIGDFIIRRADGTAPFLFCNAVDDAMMQVSHVLRGEDHLTNTPRQIMLLRALQLPIPAYGHLSLIVGDDGAPLSKRHGSFSLQEMRTQGFLPLAIMNYLARLGHTLDNQALLSAEQLAAYFSIEKLSRSPARFDKSQLMYWQKLAVQALDLPALWHWLGTQVDTQVPAAVSQLFAETIRMNIEFPADALMWADIFFHDNVQMDAAALGILHEAGEQFFVVAEQAVERYDLDLPQVLADMKQTLGLSGKKLFMPLRIALTGKTHGPELAAVTQLLGQKKIKQRLVNAFKLASTKVT